MKNLLGMAAILYKILLVGVISSFASPSFKVSVEDVEWIRCGRLPTVKLNLRLDLTNNSRVPLTIGRVQIAQERLWREGGKGELIAGRVTDTPDEFVAPDAVNDSEKIEELQLAPNAGKTFRLTHYVHLLPTDLRSDGKSQHFIASFHITNVRRDGSLSEYWTCPIVISLPQRCESRVPQASRCLKPGEPSPNHHAPGRKEIRGNSGGNSGTDGTDPNI
ncbi:MAG: hypothetical protein LAN83_20230 [Acidobacteriia bacterium]|nr:hypothetical protein [Terriglobia bacterium]